MKTLNLTINEHILSELEYLVYLHQQHGAINAVENVDELVNTVLHSIADGSRRPSAWERQIVMVKFYWTLFMPLFAFLFFSSLV